MKPQLGEKELEILRFVSDTAPTSVRRMTTEFAEPKGLARTTVLTMLERLRKKGYLNRKKIDGIFHYLPKQSKTNLLKNQVRDFVKKSLDSSMSPFLSYLAEDAKVSSEELKQLKSIVQELEKRQKND